MNQRTLMIASFAGLLLILSLAATGKLLQKQASSDGLAGYEIIVLGDTRASGTIAAGTILADGLSDHNLMITLGRLECLDDVCNSGDDHAWRIESDGKLISQGISSYRVGAGESLQLVYS